MATSVITHTETDASGNAVDYVARFRLTTAAGQNSGFRLSNGNGIAAISMTSSVAGAISIALENNTNITPGGSFYVAELLLPSTNGGTQEAALLSSSSASPQSLYNALVSAIPSYAAPTTVPPTILSGNNTFTGTNEFNSDVYFKTNPWVDVKAYGAVGNGVTDDAPAVINAIQAAALGSRWVHFPAGTYLLDADGVFSNTGVVGLGGMKFTGAHYNASTIKLKTSGSARYLYHNGATGRLSEAYFENLGFDTDSSVNGNGFDLTSAGTEQAFVFDHCAFYHFYDAFILDGSASNDNFRFYSCYFSTIADACYLISNAQAVQHYFYGCQFNSCLGDIFVVGAGGGGEIHVFGGEVVYPSSGIASRVNVLRITDSSNVGPGNSTFNFHSFKTELKQATCSLVNAAGGGSGVADITFTDCNFDTTAGGTREAVTVGVSRRVRFVRCRLPTTNIFTYNLVSGVASANVANHGELGFDECMVPTDLSSNINLAGGGLSTVWSEGGVLNPSVQTTREATDFHYNWEQTNKGGRQPRTKVAVLKFNADIWPEVGGHEAMVRLPANCWIKAWHMFKPAAGANANNITFHLGTDDKLTIYASSVAAAQMTAISYDVDNLWINTATASNTRNVRMWATGAGAGDNIAGGYAFVEYI